MKPAYIFRSGNSDDIDQIKKLTLYSYMQFRKVISDENARVWEESLGNEITYKELFLIARCFVSEYKGNIVGCAFLIPHGNPYKWFQSDWAYIRLVAVHPDCKGNGVGKQLTQLCIDAATSAGEKTIALHTSEFQNAARHIYESMGFIKLMDLELMFGKQYYLYTLRLQ